jgi:LCP family protein required for cell wall assembly
MPEMDEHKLDQLNTEVDDLLSDVKSYLEQDGGKPAQPETPKPEAPKIPDAPQPDAPAEDAPIRASDVKIDYNKFYGETPPDPSPAPSAAAAPDASLDDAEALFSQPLTAYEQSMPAYQTAKRAEYERAREQEKERRRQQLEQEEARRMRELEEKRAPRGRASAGLKPKDEEYAEWLYEQGSGEKTRAQREAVSRYTGEADEPPAPPAKPVKKKKKGGFFRAVLVILLILALGLAFVGVFVAKQPTLSPAPGARKSGVSTILIAGTDEGSYRTDTMMLLSVDRSARKLSLVSIPRDTLVYCQYSVPKINSAYGWAGGGEKGMAELMDRVTEIIGFQPDGYVVMNLEGFKKLVDLMGGVTFDVPVDMHYSDPSQNLNIDLKKGEQRLNGEQAMEVVRFRSGYPTADLGRVTVQRNFVTAAMKQWLSVKNIYKLPSALALLKKYTKSNLTDANYIWLAETAFFCDRSKTAMATLPGAAKMISGGSYYVLNPASVAQTVNSSCNPYEKEIAAADLYIRAG